MIISSNQSTIAKKYFDLGNRSSLSLPWHSTCPRTSLVTRSSLDIRGDHSSADVLSWTRRFQIKHPAAIMRILLYPALGERQVDELMPGIGVCLHSFCVAWLLQKQFWWACFLVFQAHTDFECFTILRQDDVPSALQVQNRKGQCEWNRIFFVSIYFATNITKLLTFAFHRDWRAIHAWHICDQHWWSVCPMDQWAVFFSYKLLECFIEASGFPPILDDIFVSTRHRVLPALSKDRYSIPFFFGCDHDVPLIPPETCVTPDRPAKYETMTAGAYVHMRLSDIYKVKETWFVYPPHRCMHSKRDKMTITAAPSLL